jgi:hypothetical protein
MGLMYCAHKQPQKALALWRDITRATGYSPTMAVTLTRDTFNVVLEAISVLRTIQLAFLQTQPKNSVCAHADALVEEFAPWLLELDALQAMAIFTCSDAANQACERMDYEQVLARLEKYPDAKVWCTFNQPTQPLVLVGIRLKRGACCRKPPYPTWSTWCTITTTKSNHFTHAWPSHTCGPLICKVSIAFMIQAPQPRNQPLQRRQQAAKQALRVPHEPDATLMRQKSQCNWNCSSGSTDYCVSPRATMYRACWH